MVDMEQTGADAATCDITSGNLRYKWIGHGGRGGRDFCRLVGERLGMAVDDFGVCMVTQDKIAFASGYNRVVVAHIVDKHGCDVVQQCFDESRAMFQQQYDRYVASLESDDDAE